MARKRRQFTHKEIWADVRALPDGPEKEEMLARLREAQEIGKLVGKVRKAIKQREERTENVEE